MKRWFLLVLKLGSLVATFGLASIVLYGFAFPWSVANEALPEFRGSSKLLVGLGYESNSIDGVTNESASRTYIIIPSAFHTLATVEVTKDARGVRAEMQKLGAVQVLIAFLLGLVGLWWFFIRRHSNAHSRGVA